MKNLVPWDASWDAEIVKKSQLCTDPLAEVMQSYYSEIQKHCNFRLAIICLLKLTMEVAGVRGRGRLEEDERIWLSMV